ncbi:hypothetical protein ACYZT4_02195 [Pseudomonas sp. GB2N2]
MIDHQQGFAIDRESTMVLGKPASGGFFFVCRKIPAITQINSRSLLAGDGGGSFNERVE